MSPVTYVRVHRLLYQLLGAAAIALLSRPTFCSALNKPSIITAATTTIPPLVDVPTYSMATCNSNNNNNDDGTSTTNMNILTYATPVSVRPDRIWTIGLYKETLSYENFARDRSCILQLLTEEHVPLVQLLGGTSGKNVDKREACERLGFSWGHLPDTTATTKEQQPQVLPDCAYYLKLKAIGDIVDCGSHCVAICKVEEMFVSDDKTKPYVSTATLRDLGIITEQGRVADLTS